MYMCTDSMTQTDDEMKTIYVGGKFYPSSRVWVEFLIIDAQKLEGPGEMDQIKQQHVITLKLS